MKSEKGSIITFIIVAITILIIGLVFVGIVVEIKKEVDYGIKEGKVIDKKYISAYTTMMTSGKVIIPQYYPENYKIQLQKEINGKMKSIWVTVDKDTYHKLNVGDYYNGVE